MATVKRMINNSEDIIKRWRLTLSIFFFLRKSWPIRYESSWERKKLERNKEKKAHAVLGVSTSRNPNNIRIFNVFFFSRKRKLVPKGRSTPWTGCHFVPRVSLEKSRKASPIICRWKLTVASFLYKRDIRQGKKIKK